MSGSRPRRRFAGLVPACLLSSIAALLAGSAALAALPPNFQRAREIAAAVEAAAGRLSEPIEAVRLLEPYRYELSAGACRVEVRIIALPRAREAPPGPMPFRAVAGEVACGR